MDIAHKEYLSNFHVQYNENFGMSPVKKNFRPFSSITTLKKFPLKFLYEDVNDANKYSQALLIKDNKLTFLLGWVLKWYEKIQWDNDKFKY